MGCMDGTGRTDWCIDMVKDCAIGVGGVSVGLGGRGEVLRLRGV